MSSKKSWKSYNNQLEILISRGMAVENRGLALDYLQRIGYYRLSGYWFAFRELSEMACPLDKYSRKPNKSTTERIALDSFKAGATFQKVVNLYVYDKKLRLLVLDALERIEIALREDITHTLGEINPFAYMIPEIFHTNFSQKLDNGSGVTAYHTWLGKHAQLITRSKEESILHNKEKYGLPLPIWVACEVWDFGTLSTLFNGMREEEQDAVAERYGINNGRVFATWLRSLNYLRNVCAHHSRLWNRNIVVQPRLPKSSDAEWVVPFKSDTHAQARCFLLLKITKHLMSMVNPRSSWPNRIKNHLQEFPDLSSVGLGIRGMGAPNNWHDTW